MSFFKTLKGRIIGIFALLFVCGGVVAFSVITLKQDQDAAVAQYGEEVINLCKDVSPDGTGALPTDAKIVFLNKNLRIIDTSYQKSVATSKQAAGKADVTHVACVSSKSEVYDTTSYGATGKYTCTQYMSNVEVYVVDVKTGKTVNYKVFKGDTPPECPDKTDKDVTRTGNSPVPLDVVTALGLAS